MVIVVVPCGSGGGTPFLTWPWKMAEINNTWGVILTTHILSGIIPFRKCLITMHSCRPLRIGLWDPFLYMAILQGFSPLPCSAAFPWLPQLLRSIRHSAGGFGKKPRLPAAVIIFMFFLERSYRVFCFSKISLYKTLAICFKDFTKIRSGFSFWLRIFLS